MNQVYKLSLEEMEQVTAGLAGSGTFTVTALNVARLLKPYSGELTSAKNSSGTDAAVSRGIAILVPILQANYANFAGLSYSQIANAVGSCVSQYVNAL